MEENQSGQTAALGFALCRWRNGSCSFAADSDAASTFAGCEFLYSGAVSEVEEAAAETGRSSEEIDFTGLSGTGSHNSPWHFNSGCHHPAAAYAFDLCQSVWCTGRVFAAALFILRQVSGKFQKNFLDAVAFLAEMC